MAKYYHQHDGLKLEDVVIVHNVHDGDEYEIIEITSYDEATNTITFKTKSFSGYAIALKDGKEPTQITLTDATTKVVVSFEDPDGHKKLRGFKELVYIYMAIDWNAPGSKDTPTNRQKYALEASGLTKEDLEDPLLKAACKKYQELQDASSTVGPMIQTFRNKLHEI